MFADQARPLPPRVHRLEDLTWTQLDGLDRASTIVFLPVSPIEEHAPHLPLGMDMLTAWHLCEGVAREVVGRRTSLTAVLHPPVPLGTWTLTCVGSMEVRQRVVRDLVVDVGRSLGRQGFLHLVVLSGHGGPGHVVALEEACARLRRRPGMRAVAPVGRMIETLFSGGYSGRLGQELERRGLARGIDLAVLETDYHAGLVETSLALHLRPDLVRDGYQEYPPVAIPRRRLRFDSGTREGEGLGYLGHPARAQAEIGAAILEMATGDLCALALRLVDGEDVAAECRSRLGQIPLFWTDAPVYAAGALVGLLVAAWILWTL